MLRKENAPIRIQDTVLLISPPKLYFKYIQQDQESSNAYRSTHSVFLINGLFLPVPPLCAINSEKCQFGGGFLSQRKGNHLYSS